MDIVQEKFQVNLPYNANDDAQNGWKSDASARTKKGLQTRGNSGRYEPYAGDHYTQLPPGSKIEDQEVADLPALAAAGSLGTGSQVTDDVTAASLRVGFDKKALRPTDDEYSRQHNDAFYDDVGGYVERNNNLDRL